jgi:hypothetical protein
MIKERPILFSGAMVRGILELLKTQTRRCRGLERINEDPDAWELLTPDEYGTEGNPYVAGEDRNKSEISVAAFKPKGGSAEDFVLAPCPYGKPGDRLWVRETFFHFAPYRDAPIFCHYEGDYLYRADDLGRFGIGCHKWKPSIHMPRCASRILLEIVDIRVERLNDISPADCRAEGMPKDNNDIGVRYSFGVLWKSINGADSWAKNPWVWVVVFKKLEVAA